MDCMASAHFRYRGHRGLPILSYVSRKAAQNPCVQEVIAVARWNEVQKELRSTTSNIRSLEERIEFTERWILRFLRPSEGHHKCTSAIERSANDLLDNEIATLKAREKSVTTKWLEISAALAILLRHAVYSISDSFPVLQFNPFEKPWTFLRFFQDQSHTQYSEALGFRCSDWRKCIPVSSFTELRERDVLTAQSIRNHCEKDQSPSSWISLCDDASWLLKFTSGYTNGTVAIISVPKMDRLNVLWDRSDLLVQQSGAKCYSGKHPGGVQYAWYGHYLAYGWIPVQCIIKTVTLQHFRVLCKDYDISEGQSATHETLETYC